MCEVINLWSNRGLLRGYFPSMDFELSCHIPGLIFFASRIWNIPRTRWTLTFLLLILWWGSIYAIHVGSFIEFLVRSKWQEEAYIEKYNESEKGLWKKKRKMSQRARNSLLNGTLNCLNNYLVFHRTRKKALTTWKPRNGGNLRREGGYQLGLKQGVTCFQTGFRLLMVGPGSSLRCFEGGYDRECFSSIVDYLVRITSHAW